MKAGVAICWLENMESRFSSMGDICTSLAVVAWFIGLVIPRLEPIPERRLGSPRAGFGTIRYVYPVACQAFYHSGVEIGLYHQQNLVPSTACHTNENIIIVVKYERKQVRPYRNWNIAGTENEAVFWPGSSKTCLFDQGGQCFYDTGFEFGGRYLRRGKGLSGE